MKTNPSSCPYPILVQYQNSDTARVDQPSVAAAFITVSGYPDWAVSKHIAKTEMFVNSAHQRRSACATSFAGELCAVNVRSDQVIGTD